MLLDRALLIALLMMHCRTGTVQSNGRALLRAWCGPGSAAHRFAPSRSEIVERLVYALALRRIRDTSACMLAVHQLSAAVLAVNLGKVQILPAGGLGLDASGAREEVRNALRVLGRKREAQVVLVGQSRADQRGLGLRLLGLHINCGSLFRIIGNERHGISDRGDERREQLRVLALELPSSPGGQGWRRTAEQLVRGPDPANARFARNLLDERGREEVAVHGRAPREERDRAVGLRERDGEVVEGGMLARSEKPLGLHLQIDRGH